MNPNHTEIVDKIAERQEGVTILHEVLESYIGGQNSQKTGVSAPSTIKVDPNPPYEAAHGQAEKIDPRHENNYRPIYNRKDGYYIENINTGKSKRVFKY